MDGVFMKKLLKFAFLLTLLVMLLEGAGLLTDKQSLQDNLIRLHVVANSDSKEDQNVKLQVRDAVTEYLEPLLRKCADREQARAFLVENLSALEQIANQVLQQAGTSDTAKVTLKQEAFDTRVYDTFTLPAGVYESLRIEIGQGAGKNWWCVVFPSLCLPATTQAFQDTAVAAGFDDALASTLAQEDGYELRFYLLERIGKWENFFFQDES